MHIFEIVFLFSSAMFRASKNDKLSPPAPTEMLQQAREGNSCSDRLLRFQSFQCMCACASPERATTIILPHSIHLFARIWSDGPHNPSTGTTRCLQHSASNPIRGKTNSVEFRQTNFRDAQHAKHASWILKQISGVGTTPQQYQQVAAASKSVSLRTQTNTFVPLVIYRGGLGIELYLNLTIPGIDKRFSFFVNPSTSMLWLY